MSFRLCDDVYTTNEGLQTRFYFYALLGTILQKKGAHSSGDRENMRPPARSIEERSLPAASTVFSDLVEFLPIVSSRARYMSSGR